MSRDNSSRSPRVEDLEGRRLMTTSLVLVGADFPSVTTHLSATSTHDKGDTLTVTLPASEAGALAVQHGDSYRDITVGKTVYHGGFTESITVTGHGKSAKETIEFINVSNRVSSPENGHGGVHRAGL